MLVSLDISSAVSIVDMRSAMWDRWRPGGDEGPVRHWRGRGVACSWCTGRGKGSVPFRCGENLCGMLRAVVADGRNQKERPTRGKERKGWGGEPERRNLGVGTELSDVRI